MEDEPIMTRIIAQDSRTTVYQDIYARPLSGGNLVVTHERPTRTWKWRLKKTMLFVVTMPLGITFGLMDGIKKTWELCYRDSSEERFVGTDFIYDNPDNAR